MLSRITLSIAAIGMAVIPLLSQTATGQKPSFDAASIKPNDSGPGAMMILACNGSDTGSTGDLQIPKGRCILRNVTVKMLIAYAFKIPQAVADQQITGGASWIDSDRFDIEGKAEDTDHPTQADLKEMLQTLLQDRCKLVIHKASKEVQAYDLLVAGGGSKLTRNDADDMTPPDIRGGKGSITGTNVRLSQFAGVLGIQVKGVVTDRTNLRGNYNVRVTWQPSGDLSAAPDVSGGASIFSALQEQLGLRLVSAKRPAEVIVIDTVQKPTAN